MPTLEQLIKQLGKTRTEVVNSLGDPDDLGGETKKYPNPSVYKYGKYELHFLPWKEGHAVTLFNATTHQIIAKTVTVRPLSCVFDSLEEITNSQHNTVVVNGPSLNWGKLTKDAVGNFSIINDGGMVYFSPRMIRKIIMENDPEDGTSYKIYIEAKEI